MSADFAKARRVLGFEARYDFESGHRQTFDWFMAQGLDPFEAAAAGAYIHGRCGELAAAELGTDISVVAGDLVKALPKSLAELQ